MTENVGMGGFKLTKNIYGNKLSVSPIVIFSCTDVASTARNVNSKSDNTIITKFWIR